MIQSELTFLFDIFNDSFIYDPVTETILFIDVHRISFSVERKYKFSEQTFKTTMIEKLTALLTSFKVSDLNLDFELTDFKINKDEYFINSLIENYRKKDVKDSEEDNQIHTDNSGKENGEFQSALSIEISKADSYFWLTIVLDGSKKKIQV